MIKRLRHFISTLPDYIQTPRDTHMHVRHVRATMCLAKKPYLNTVVLLGKYKPQFYISTGYIMGRLYGPELGVQDCTYVEKSQRYLSIAPRSSVLLVVLLISQYDL